MARKGKQAVRSGRWPAWLLVVIGIAIGAIAMHVAMRHGMMPMSTSPARPAPQANAPNSQANGAGIAALPQSTKPKYDFYSVLPEKDVVIPDAQLSAEASAEQKTGKVSPSAANNLTPVPGGHYLLQVGSFTSKNAAETLKAKLALKGFRADIDTIQVKGQTYNRVHVGPFASASALAAAKDKLAQAGVTHTIALKVN